MINAINQATPVCIAMETTAFFKEVSSRLMVAKAATHGIYNRVNTRKEYAAA